MKEIHIHIGGAYPLQHLKQVANDDDYNDLVSILSQVQNRELDYHKAFDAFTYVNKIMNKDELIEAGVKAICEELSKETNYVELRTGLKTLDGTLETYLNAVLTGIKKGTENNDLTACLILSLRRDTNNDIAKKTIDLAIKYKDSGIVGIDISGDSTQGNCSEIFEALLRAKAVGFPITLHIGETPKESLEQQILELQTLRPNRIGHGVHLYDETWKFVLENRICIEMCLSSALYAGMVSDIKDHPALQLLKSNYPVAICTDDPLIFGTTLSKEYEICSKVTNLTIDELKDTQSIIEPYIFYNKI